MEQSELILVTGATGYIGGRLVPRLLEAGYRVRCLVRDAERLKGRPWTDRWTSSKGMRCSLKPWPLQCRACPPPTI